MKKKNITQTMIEDSKQIINWLKKVPAVLALHSFITISIFVLIDLAIGGLFYYKYIYLAENANLTTSQNQTTFDEKKYKQVLEIWQKREENFNKPEENNIKSPF